MTPELCIGSQVWERIDPMADPGTTPPIKGGTVVDVRTTEDGVRLRVITGTRQRAGRRSIETAWIDGEDLDPAMTKPWDHRAASRATMARSILGVLGQGTGEASGYDWRMLGWAVQLWLGPDAPATIPVTDDEGDSDG